MVAHTDAPQADAKRKALVNRDDIKRTIQLNLQKSGIESAEIRVQPDPFGGWRISVVSDGFSSKPQPERRRLALEGIDQNKIEFADFLTSKEREWAGALISDSDLSNLPFWPDAFARTTDREPAPEIVLPSDLDADIPAPIYATFYSVRGGVGRSTALGYAAQILASKGRRVVCVDFDLEAPGLASLFGVDGEVREGQGVLPLLISIDRNEAPDASKHLIKIPKSDELYCLPAGLPNAEYARLLQFIQPTAWYAEERNPLRELVDIISNKLPFKPDVVMFDSRTGISEISAPLLFELADIAVIVFFPHPQAQNANKEVVRALMASKTARKVDGRNLTPEPRFLVSPIPSSRIPEVVTRYRSRSSEWVSDWLAESAPRLPLLADSVADTVHFIPYREDIATSDSVLGNSDVWRDYEPVAEWIERFLPSESDLSNSSVQMDKSQVLPGLSFSAGTAEHQDEFLMTFVEVGSTRKALDPSIPLVLGRKGVGKTAVFRRLLEKPDHVAVPITAPAPLRGNRPWVLTADGFKEVEVLLRRCGLNWRHFWQMLIVFGCEYALPDTSHALKVGNVQVNSAPTSSVEVLRVLEQLLQQDKASLHANDWLDKLDLSANSLVILLFDGLDTGFGNTSEDRERRRPALEGLFEVLIDRGDRGNLRFKIVLREDIWRALRFENKSHLYGRYVTLDWKDQPTYYKVVLKQALRSQQFKDLVLKARPGVAPDRMDDWDESEVIAVWNLLVGERMKGEKTAFTRNWVWNRLADANGDHSPRYLLQLFREVTSWEIREQKKSVYDRSVLRPRAFSQTLPTVSGQAFGALIEEFPELKPLFDKLRSIGRTPVNSEELSDLSEILPLAREVGLIGIYEGTEENVERYRVPEIYRYALEMTRKGQA